MVQGNRRRNALMVLMGLGGSTEEPLQTPAMQLGLDRQTFDVYGPEDRNHQVSPAGPLRIHVLGSVVRSFALA
jgi:hypothetical protein